MANLQKYNSLQLGHLFKHYERAKDENGNYIKFGNQSIDTSKTYLNYDLSPVRNMSQYDFFKQRKSEVKCLNSKDVNVMCSWIITLPKSFPKDKEKEFFEQSYEFLKNKYGEKNTISCYVHLDEKQPHMHFSFLPIVIDKKKNIEKISAKELITKNELKIFHTKLKQHLENYFKFEVEILNDATKDGNKTIKELKQISDEITKEKSELQRIKNEIDSIYKANKYLSKSDIEKLKTPHSTFFGNEVKIDKELYEKVVNQVFATHKLKNINIKLNKENENLKVNTGILDSKIVDLEYDLELSEKSNQDLINKVDDLREKINDYRNLYAYIDQTTIDEANLERFRHALDITTSYNSKKYYISKIQELEKKLGLENTTDNVLKEPKRVKKRNDLEL